MRSDRSLPADFRDTKQWTVDPSTGQQKPGYERLNKYGPEFHKHSYSGYERNKLFWNQGGTRFLDISGMSGADTIADSRSWVKWDFDRDGWQDIAVVNANKPLLQLFRNQLGEKRHRSSQRFIAVQFQGANQAAQPSVGLSARDGIGAVVTVKGKEISLFREFRCGEGYAAQNSSTLLIGIGGESSVELSIAWPSGKISGPISVEAGKLVRCFEQDTGRFEISDYQAGRR